MIGFLLSRGAIVAMTLISHMSKRATNLDRFAICQDGTLFFVHCQELSQATFEQKVDGERHA